MNKMSNKFILVNERERLSIITRREFNDLRGNPFLAAMETAI
jgi:hypothetical protein